MCPGFLEYILLRIEDRLIYIVRSERSWNLCTCMNVGDYQWVIIHSACKTSFVLCYVWITSFLNDNSNEMTRNGSKREACAQGAP